MTMPEEDATWPTCKRHQDPVVRHWCDWTAEFFRGNSDASTIVPGYWYCIPIVPLKKAYAKIRIADTLINGICAELLLIKDEGSVFAPDEREVPLGFWTQGEGRLTIASVIADWADGIVPEKCEAATHAYAQEMAVHEVLRSDGELGKKLYWWNLAYHGMCTFCWEHKQSAGHVSVDASSQGLDPKDFSSGGGFNAGGAVQNVTVTNNTANTARPSTQDLLRQKFRQ